MDTNKTGYEDRTFFFRIGRENKTFLIPFAIVWLAALVSCFVYSQMDLQLLLNPVHTPFLDFFFKWFTYVGDTAFYLFALVVGLAVCYRFSVYLAVMGLVQIILVYALKQLADHPRPLTVFTEHGLEGQLQLVQGVNMRYWNSFPSGHTATAFSLFFLLSIFLKNKWLKLGCFIMALTAAYSRIYLSQHFLEDTVAGAAVGVLLAGAVCLVMYHFPKVRNARSLDYGLLRKPS